MQPHPPRRSRSHAGDGAAAGNVLSLAGNGQRSTAIRRQGLDGPDVRSDETGAGNASDVENLSEEEFFRVAVEKILEQERLGGGDSLNPEQLDLRGVLQSGDENLNGDKGGSNQGRKVLDNAMIRSSSTTKKSFGSTLNSAAKPSRSGGRCRARDRRGSAGVRRQRASDAARATAGAPPCQPPTLPRGGRGSASKAKQRATAMDKETGGQANATLLRGAAGRNNSSLLSLYEAQSVEQSALTGVMPEGFVVDGSVVGIGDKVGASDYDAKNITRGHWVPVVADGDTYDDDVDDYPWSEEGRAWSRGGGRRQEHRRDRSDGNNDTEESKMEDRVEHRLDGDDCDLWEQRLRLAEDMPRRTQTKVSEDDTDDEVFGDIDPPRRTATNYDRTVGKISAEGEEQWDDVFGTQRNPSRISPPRVPFTMNPRQASRNGHARTTGRPDDHPQSIHGLEHFGSASLGAGNMLPVGSYPHERGCADRPEYIPTRTAATVVTAEQQYSNVSTSERDPTGRGARLWSSTDNDASVRGIGSRSSSSVGEDHGARGLAIHDQVVAGEGQWDSPTCPIGGYGAVGIEVSARSPMRPQKAFFDPATSSADKARHYLRRFLHRQHPLQYFYVLCQTKL